MERRGMNKVTENVSKVRPQLLSLEAYMPKFQTFRDLVKSQ